MGTKRRRRPERLGTKLRSLRDSLAYSKLSGISLNVLVDDEVEMP
jgi:hypothetical protein